MLRGGRGLILKIDGRILAELLHILQHFRCGGVAVLGVQRHTLENNLFQPQGNVGIQRGRLGRAAIDMLNGHRHRGFSVKGRPARHHLIHDNTEGIQIRSGIGVAALGLLGRNIVDGAQSLLGQGIALAHNPGNAEVHDLDAAVLQHHHIVGLDVPMDNAPAMGVFQALGDLHGKMQGLLPVEHALDFHVLLQGNTVDELHDDIVRRIRRGNVIDLDNIGMAEHGNSLTLRPEPAAELLVPGEFVF